MILFLGEKSLWYVIGKKMEVTPMISIVSHSVYHFG